jgi:predicted translin family RNA/ssDNA-binding protein
MKDKEANKSKEFSKGREFAVVLEKIYTEIKVISEGQTALREKLDSAIGMIAKNTEDITMVKLQIFAMKDDITKINGKLAKLEEDIRVIKSDFGSRLTRLEAVK